VLPHWLQWIAWCFPTAYVFEGMRAVLLQNEVRLDYLVAALVLDALYLALGSLILLWSFRRARRTGALLQMGE
jgi:ABC-2 type transport system permease protein